MSPSGTVQVIGTTACLTEYGWVGLAWSEFGLVAVTLPKQAEFEALRRLPEVTPGDAQPANLDVQALIDNLQLYFQGQDVVLDEPLDPAIGTPFQQRVWTITRAIPRGQTRTYGSIAREAGSPRSAQAVGQAMARNPRPIIVPCHRVVGSDGTLTGFGGGLEMKRRMLAMEGADLSFRAEQQAFDWGDR
jgi:methylated-DNA-[protein]-cysteine S-methyltransferase